MIAQGSTQRTPAPSSPQTSLTPAKRSPAPVAEPESATRPKGVDGAWVLTFSDEFSGSRLDTSRWANLDGSHMNNVTASAANVRVRDGQLILTLSSRTTGAYISSAPSDGAGENGYLLPVGGFVEARVHFRGNGTRIYTWPAWWTCGPDWPEAGEHDIAEGLASSL